MQYMHVYACVCGARLRQVPIYSLKCLHIHLYTCFHVFQLTSYLTCRLIVQSFSRSGFLTPFGASGATGAARRNHGPPSCRPHERSSPSPWPDPRSEWDCRWHWEMAGLCRKASEPSCGFLGPLVRRICFQLPGRWTMDPSRQLSRGGRSLVRAHCVPTVRGTSSDTMEPPARAQHGPRPPFRQAVLSFSSRQEQTEALK